jgi:hypothetical protein
VIASSLPGGAPSGKPTCINLRERLGDRFKLWHEESYQAERPEFRAEEEVWLQIIPCRSGHISPWGGNLLAACLPAGSVANRVRALPFTQVVQDGSDGANIVFPVDRFEEVAELVHPRRRRRLSLEGRRKLAQAGAKTRFQHGVGSKTNGRSCEFGGVPDQEEGT